MMMERTSSTRAACSPSGNLDQEVLEWIRAHISSSDLDWRAWL